MAPAGKVTIDLASLKTHHRLCGKLSAAIKKGDEHPIYTFVGIWHHSSLTITLHKFTSKWMNSGYLLVSLNLTDSNVPGSVVGAWRVCCSLTNIDEIIMISAVTDNQVTAVSLRQLTQVECKP